MDELSKLLAAKHAAQAELSEAARSRANAEKHIKQFRLPVKGATETPPGALYAEAVELLQQRIEAEAVARARYESADRAYRVAEAAQPKPKLHADAKGSLRTPETYHPGGLSWFKDSYAAHLYRDQRAIERLTANDRRVRTIMPGKVLIRTPMSDSDGAGFAPPLWLTALWTDVVRAAAPLSSMATETPMSQFGLNETVGRLTTGADVALQSAEGDTAHTGTAASTVSQSPYATLAGVYDIDLPIFDRSAANLDTVITTSLGNSFGEQLEDQVTNGNGTATATSGSLVGVLNTSNILSLSYTDASPTQQELLPVLYQAYSQFMVTRKRVPDCWVMSPEFIAWIAAAEGSSLPTFNQGGFVSPTDANGGIARFLGLPVLSSDKLPKNLGAGTNQGIIVLAKAADFLLAQQVTSFDFRQVLSGTLTARIAVQGGAFFHADTYGGASIATISGTGLVVPTGYTPS